MDREPSHGIVLLVPRPPIQCAGSRESGVLLIQRERGSLRRSGRRLRPRGC
jgi:hypothetical protein